MVLSLVVVVVVVVDSSISNITDNGDGDGDDGDGDGDDNNDDDGDISSTCGLPRFVIISHKEEVISIHSTPISTTINNTITPIKQRRVVLFNIIIIITTLVPMSIDHLLSNDTLSLSTSLLE